MTLLFHPEESLFIFQRIQRSSALAFSMSCLYISILLSVRLRKVATADEYPGTQSCYNKAFSTVNNIHSGMIETQMDLNIHL